jgi:hypothetical protein
MPAFIENATALKFDFGIHTHYNPYEGVSTWVSLIHWIFARHAKPILEVGFKSPGVMYMQNVFLYGANHKRALRS